MGTTLDIILVSGLSGAGKSVVLNALEDLGRFCIDNLPAAMLETFVSHALRDGANFGGKRNQLVHRREAIGCPANLRQAPHFRTDAETFDAARRRAKCGLV